MTEPIQRPPVVLIGPMAAGKSSIGRRLARLLSRDFIDTDKRIVAEHGPISEIFSDFGEAKFRELEHTAVADSMQDGHIIALGGGAVLHPSTRELLSGATVVLVNVSEEAVAGRINNDKRPLLREEGIAAWRRIADEREPIYRALADLEADTSRRPMVRIAEEIAAWVLEHEHHLQQGTATSDRSGRIE